MYNFHKSTDIFGNICSMLWVLIIDIFWKIIYATLSTRLSAFGANSRYILVTKWTKKLTDLQNCWKFFENYT